MLGAKTLHFVKITFLLGEEIAHAPGGRGSLQCECVRMKCCVSLPVGNQHVPSSTRRNGFCCVLSAKVTKNVERKKKKSCESSPAWAVMEMIDSQWPIRTVGLGCFPIPA